MIPPKTNHTKKCINVEAINNLHLRVRSIITDSRTPASDYSQSAFFALTTPVGDGHRYIDDMYDKGVRIFVVKDLPCNVNSLPDAEFIIVDDVTQALTQSATAIRNAVACPIIGITGSIGKTMFKEMLNAALGQRMRIIRSPRSWNSQIGVPMSLWKLRDNTQLGIIEAGISRKGEMAKLNKIIRPTIGVFTALSHEHDSGFESIEQKADEKALLFAGCQRVYYPKDDTRIESALKKVVCVDNLIAVEGSLADICLKVAIDLGANSTDAKQRIEQASQYSGRIDLSEVTELTSVGYDHYTTDIDGIATALDFAHRRMIRGRKLIAVIGDLDCYDEDKVSVYSQLEKQLQAANVSKLVAVGSTISKYAQSFTSNLSVVTSDVLSDIYALLSEYDIAGSLIYINTPDKKSSETLRDRLCAVRHITRMNINLEALTSNFKYYKSLIPHNTRTVAMIKASAYGCGAIEVARSLQAAGIDYFAVAVVDEGAALRAAGVDTPIIVLDPWCTDPQAIVTNQLEATLIAPNIDLIRSLDKAASEANVDKLNVHIKLDTGMHRLGLNEDQIDDFAQMLSCFPRLNAVSVFSHLATADCLDKDEYTKMQLNKFTKMCTSLEKALAQYSGKNIHLLRHILNTAGTERFGSIHHHDMVRLGLGLYGISPTVINSNLRPVASLVTTVIAISNHKAGETIGYGQRGILERDSIVATLPIGYADGINRHLGCGQASFLINGHPCPTVGNICMDLCMVDITDCPDARIGSNVEIFGDNAPIERLSVALGTIPYEILTSVSPRVKRLYFRE